LLNTIYKQQVAWPSVSFVARDRCFTAETDLLTVCKIKLS